MAAFDGFIPYGCRSGESVKEQQLGARVKRPEVGKRYMVHNGRDFQAKRGKLIGMFRELCVIRYDKAMRNPGVEPFREEAFPVENVTFYKV
jgi:hypothetical protein